METINRVRVNIDAGLATIPDFINIDASGKGELTLDVGKEKLPFDDDSVDLIFSYHALEHVSDYLFAISEIHRVLKHGGRLLVGLPYVSLTEYHLINPYHLHNFNEYSFDFFDADKFGDTDAENPVLFKKQFHRLHYLGMFKHFPKPLQKWCRRHLLNVVQKFDVGLIAVKDTEVALPASNQQTLLQEFQKCFEARIPHRSYPGMVKS